MTIGALGAVVVGFGLLVWSADRLILGASALSRHYGISPVVIGVTLVGIGTAAPEFFIGALAAVAGHAALPIGNAIGSNFTNSLLVVGASILAAPLIVPWRIMRRELPILLGVTVLAYALLRDGTLSRLDGAVLGVGLVVYLGLPLFLRDTEHVPDLGDLGSVSVPKAAAWIVLGLLLCFAGARAVVFGAVSLATTFGVSDRVIALAVVSVGSSLPELAASVMAARRGEHGITLGNVVGSNTMNLLGVLALPGLFAPGPVSAVVWTRDYPLMVGVTGLLTACLVLGYRRGAVPRWIGGVLVLAFAAYIAWVILAGDAAAA